MDTARPMPPTAQLLRRWLCAWLALLTLTQMLGSTLAGLHGTWHRHRPALQSQAAPSTPLVHWRHGGVKPAVDAHVQLHARGEVHEHAATDASVLPIGVDTAGDAVAQLAAMLAPGVDASWTRRSDAEHVHAGSAAWAATSRSIAPLLRPPRG